MQQTYNLSSKRQQAWRNYETFGREDTEERRQQLKNLKSQWAQDHKEHKNAQKRAWRSD